MASWYRVAVVALLVLSVFVVGPRTAQAIPLLQLYAEGATYDGATDTWVFSGSGPYTLWVLGLVGGSEGKGSILGVSLVAAYSSAETGTISITPTTTSLVTDPSTPQAPTITKTVTDGSIPEMSNGMELPTHGVYGDGTNWTQYALGDFTLTDSPIADLIGTFPTDLSDWTGVGQINAYTVNVTGFTTVHFDAFDHITCGTKVKAIKAPFSHDAEGTGLPEPGTILLLGSGLIGLAGWGRASRRN